MSLNLLPNECISKIFYFLNIQNLYKCLYVNRNWCRLAIPEIWRDPFAVYDHSNKPVILVNTLIKCFNEEEISLIPYTINFPKNKHSPLFEYGKYIRTISQHQLELNVLEWFKAFNNTNTDFYYTKSFNSWTRNRKLTYIKHRVTYYTT